MLSYNVAALLRAAPGTTERQSIVMSGLLIADDLELAGPVAGEVRLSRTRRSILVRAHVDASIKEHCSRCLRPTVTPVSVDIDEEALPSVDIDTGLPLDTSAEPEALRLDDHHQLDLEPSIRDAISLAEPIAPLCRPDCRGLCPTCGADLNVDALHLHTADDVDPRLAALRALRDRLE
jgi:uncharacterized protein